MIVALRAIDRHAEKRDRDRLSELRRLVVEDEEVARAVLKRAAGGGDEVSHHQVPRRVQFHLPAYPLIVAPHGLLRQLVAIDQKQIAPVVSPVIHKFRTREKGVDEVIALSRGCLREERARLVRRWKHPDGVQERSPDELGIRALIRWRQVQFAQFFQHALVDKIPRLERGEGG